jgi:hypothetical protein
VHIRAGGRIEKIAPLSQTIPGTLAQWRDWTGLPFDTTGPVLASGALAPVYCSVEHDYAVLVEANMWVRHVVPHMTMGDLGVQVADTNARVRSLEEGQTDIRDLLIRALDR